MRLESTNIYFIGNVELGSVKIGRSNNPKKRLADLQIGNSKKLVLYSVVEDVTPEYEKKLHRLLGHIRLKGEWFKLTDELIHFMINKTDETSYGYKINNGYKINPDPLDIAIDKIVKPTKNRRGWVSENQLIRIIKRYLIINNYSPHFDRKNLRHKLKQKDIHTEKIRGEWIYPEHYADETAIQPGHYLGPASILKVEDLNSWDLEWSARCTIDSKKWKKFKFSVGYSYLIKIKDSIMGVTTITTNIPGITNKVVIYKGGLFNAAKIS